MVFNKYIVKILEIIIIIWYITLCYNSLYYNNMSNSILKQIKLKSKISYKGGI